MQVKNRKMNNRGITLIALVITIIVLLILAGVTIATLTGENGILTKATTAKDKMLEAEAKEVVQLEAIGSIDDNGKFNCEDFKTNVKKNLGANIKDNGNTVTVTYKGYDVTIDAITGKIVLEPAKVGEIVTGKNNRTYTNTTEDGKTLTAVIPVGYGIMQGLDDISEGLVITDDFEKDGNEFVWIPVETAVTKDEAEGTETKAMAVNLETDPKKEPIYRGLLYNFKVDGSEVIKGCTTTTSGFREPDIVEKYDKDTTYNDGLFTKESLQKDYNDMIKSVSNNYGFYVSRYEMSLDASKNAQSKKLQRSATSDTDSANMWYGLYDKAKKYAEKTDSGKSVVSSMIWGSQYDAMMNWMQKGGVKVSTTTPVTDADRNQDTQRRTGAEEKDKLKNVYDLLGNRTEWILEAFHSDLRILRGGDDYYSYSPANRDYAYFPHDPRNHSSSRLTLYIK